MLYLQDSHLNFSRFSGFRLLIAAAGLFLSVSANSINLPPDFVLETYASGMNRPIEMQWAAGGKLFVATKSGEVYVIENDVRLDTLFIDLSPEVNSFADRGLLGMALHPNFPATPWVYFGYVYDPPETLGQSGHLAPNGDGQRVSRVIRVEADSANNFNTAVPGSEVVLLGTNSTWANIGDPSVDQEDLTVDWSCGNDGAYIEDCLPAEGISHSMGTLAFGADGSLYVSYGDASTWTTVDVRSTRAIIPDSLAGKILRINPVTGAGYADNPFVELDPETNEPDLTSNRAKVWQMGFRNPYRFAIDPNTDELWIGDVGWNRWEELNHSALKGANFGWPCYEGGSGVLLEQGGFSVLGICQDLYAAGGVAAAQYGYPHVTGIGGAIVAGDFYDRINWPAEYQGALFFADFAFEEIHYAHIEADDSVDIHSFATDVLLVDISVGPDGNLYLAKIADDTIDRIVYGDPTNLPVTSFGAGFSGATPATGWAYLWNSTTALGDPAGYESLLWDGASLFDSDGVAGLPDATAMGDGHIGEGVMHPGKGVDDGKLFNRYAIAEYTVGESGYYSITNSFVSSLGCITSDGTEIITMVDDAILPGSQVGLVVAGNLDRNLGYLVAGSRIAVALGPNGSADCDDTTIDWDITYVAGEAPAGSPPVATILSPAPTDVWVVGDTVNFSGSATDPDDGALTGDLLSWEVILHHNTHEHLDAGQAIGATGSFLFPDHGANTYAELCLTAMDSDGRTDTTCVDVRPQTVDYTFDSVPSGLNLTFNSAIYMTPFTIEKIAINSERLISAPDLQGQYQFDNWSIGGGATQQIIIGDVNQSIAANYNDLGGVPLAYDVMVTAGSDDAEELANSNVNLASTDLELVAAETDGASQIVGLRFAGIPLPQNAQIVDAYIQFSTDEATADPVSLLIEGQSAGNAATFLAESGNISGRPRTRASIAWEPGPWAVVGERGYLQRTPSIAPVISEIVSGDEWAAGNALAIIVTGTGKRVAMSYERFNANAPRLHVSYIEPVVPLEVEIAVRPRSNELVSTWNLEGSVTTVAVLGSNLMDVTQIDMASLKLGVGEALAITHVDPVYANFDGDSEGILDAEYRFRVQQVGVVCTDTQVTLVGETLGGDLFEGKDIIQPINCPTESCHP